ncbi:MAG: nucleotidyltransferase domain-containing protein [Planctomycetota bacterium]
MNLERWRTYVDSLAINPLFVTVSGAHLYGFPSPDSDVDLRGTHCLPLEAVIGLDAPPQTFDDMCVWEGIEVDIVSHDVEKYFSLLLKNNGYILEQVFSPWVVTGDGFVRELRAIASRCITRNHYHHYHGFYRTQRRLIEKETSKRAKSVLYAYRVLMTGIYLMKSGKVEANINHLNEEFKLPYIAALVAAKKFEKVEIEDLDWDFHSAELDRLEAELEGAFHNSRLGESRDRSALNDWLIRIRLGETS